MTFPNLECKKLNTFLSRTFNMLSVTLGCMYSGKTTALIRRQVEGIHLILDYDTTNSTQPYPSILFSHDEVSISCYKTKTLDIDISIADVISINEAQFFPDLIPFIKSALKQSKKVYVYGLDGDFKQDPFGQMLELLPLADEYVKLYAICQCGERAAFSKRMTATKEQYAPHDEYQASCRTCLRV